MEDQFAPYCVQLDRVFRKMLTRMGRDLSDMLVEGITPPQFMLMRGVGQATAMTVTELAESIGVTPSAITLLADRLHGAGLLTRERDQSDRRIVRMKLTEAGAAKLTELEGMYVELMRNTIGLLPPDDLDQLLRIYTRLADLLDKPESDR